jgi:hypothetical protein
MVLLLQQILKHFIETLLLNKESTVWSNIRAWDYKLDLKKGGEREKRPATTLLRYTISQNKDHLTYFMHLLDNDWNISKESWELLIRVSPDPQLMYNIMNFMNDNQDPHGFNFNEIVDTKNQFRLLYVIRIIGYFLHYSDMTKQQVKVVFNDEEEEKKEEPKAGEENKEFIGPLPKGHSV